MRRAAQVDANQGSIVQIFRQLGASVECLHAVGGGLTDLLVGYRGFNVLCEVKDPDKKESARQLTEPQKTFFSTWRGQKCIIETREDCHALIATIGKLSIEFPKVAQILCSVGLDKIQLKELKTTMRIG